MENKQKANEIAVTIMSEGHIDKNGMCQRRDLERAAMAMAKLKDEEHNECRKDILTLVNLIPCNEENESVINDIKTLLK